MSQVRRGRAELAIIIQAQNEAAAVLKGLNQQIKDVEKSTDGLSKSTDKNASKANGLSKAWKSVVGEGEKVDKVKGRVDMLRGVVEFAIPIIGGLVAAFAAFETVIDPIDKANASIRASKAALESAELGLISWRNELGIATQAELDFADAVKARTRFMAEVVPAMEAMLQAAADLREAELAAGINAILFGEGATPGVDKLRARLEVTRAEYDRMTKSAGEAVEAAKLATAATSVSGEILEYGPPAPPKGPKSKAALKHRLDIAGALRDLLAAPPAADGWFEQMFTADKVDIWAEYAAGAREAMAAVSEFGAVALGVLGDISDAEAERLQAQEMQETIAANTADAVSSFIFQQIEDENALMALLAVKELAMGFATLATPVISAGHFTAAALLGAQAAIGAASSAGGSDSGPADTGGGSGSGSGSGGGAVYNFYSGVTDGQSVQLAIARTSRQAAGTGRAARRGV